MTDFATWWKRADGGLGLPALVGLLLLGGCGSPPTAEAPPPPASPPPAPPVSVSPAIPPGLTPLPSSQQVVAAFQVGRKDPFGTVAPPPVRVSGAAKPPPPPPPAFLDEFRVTGVILTGGRREAVVTYKTLSGSVRPGDRGGRNTDLLPPGWSVASVDVQKGRLILQSGSRKVTVDL